jgi:hypothetical protein
VTEKLVVTKSFQSFVRGDIITDLVKIQQILGSDHAGCVRPVIVTVHGEG